MTDEQPTDDQPDSVTVPSSSLDAASEPTPLPTGDDFIKTFSKRRLISRLE